MSWFIELFNFSFLKKIDRYILINYPLIWSYKLPYIIFFILIFDLIFFLILVSFNFNEDELIVIKKYLEYSSFLMLIPFYFWMKNQNNYAPEKVYGRFYLKGLIEILLVCMVFIVLELASIGINIYMPLKQYTLHSDMNNTVIDQMLITEEQVEIKTLKGDSKLMSSFLNESDYRKILELYKSEALKSKIIDTKFYDMTIKKIIFKKNEQLIYYEINFVKESIYLLTVLLAITLLLMIYRLIGMHDFLFFISAFYTVFYIINNYIFYEALYLKILVQLFLMLILYIITKNKLLLFVTIVIIGLVDILYYSKYFLESKLLGYITLGEFYLIVTILVIILLSSYFKRQLLKIASEPKKL